MMVDPSPMCHESPGIRVGGLVGGPIPHSSPWASASGSASASLGVTELSPLPTPHSPPSPDPAPLLVVSWYCPTGSHSTVKEDGLRTEYKLSTQHVPAGWTWPLRHRHWALHYPWRLQWERYGCLRWGYHWLRMETRWWRQSQLGLLWYRHFL